MLKLLKYKKEIPSDTSCICDLISGILAFIQDSHGPIDDCVEFELKVILNELILNAVKHGNKYVYSKKVKASVSTTREGYVSFLIEDEGEGYDYQCRLNNSQDALDDICNLKETGRGILIVSNLCDKIKFNKKGNRVLALKRI